jgi:hypothetical protein
VRLRLLGRHAVDAPPDLSAPLPSYERREEGPMTTTPQHPAQQPADGFVSTEELIRRHRAQPITSADDLVASEDPFESDTEYEEFLADLYASRRADIA